MKSMTPFCMQLRTRGEQLGLSDSEIARRIGISQSRYSNYTRGIREPHFDTLARICRVLHTTPNELLGFAAPGAKEEDLDLQCIIAAAQSLTPDNLKMAAGIMDAMVARQEKVVVRSKKVWMRSALMPQGRRP
jgi:transcriptional regulator with XRE-family HTH domain